MCDDMITNIEVNEIFKTKCHRSFCKRKKLNSSIDFMSQSYFKVPRDIRLNTTHCFLMKLPNKR